MGVLMMAAWKRTWLKPSIMPSPFSSAISMTSRICSMKDSRSLSRMNSLRTW